MDTYDRVMLVVYDVIDRLNESDAPDRAVEKGPDAVLLGSGGSLDRQGFLRFSGMVEERVERRFGMTVRLTDVVADRQLDPVTVSSLVDAIVDRMSTVVERSAGDAQ